MADFESSSSRDSGAVGGDLLAQLAATPVHRRRDLALGRVLDQLQAVLGNEFLVSGVAPDEKLFEIGVTSLNLHDLRARLETLCGIELPIPLFFAYSSLSALADHLVGLVREEPVPAAPERPPATALDRGTHVASLSEEEAQERLRKKMEDLEGRFGP